MKRTGLRRTVNIMLLIIGTYIILYFGSKFLIPLAFAGLFAMLFHPLAAKLVNKGVPRGGAIAICGLILLLTVGAFIGVIGYQANQMAQEWPSIKEKLKEKQKKLETSLVEKTQLLTRERLNQIKQNITRQSGSVRTWLKNFIGSFVDVLTTGFLILVYFILIMIEYRRFKNFVIRLTPKEETANEIMTSARQIAFKYLVGRVVLIIILSVLYSVGFLAFGLKNAIPIAILAAVFSFIPFLGNIIGGLIAVFIGLATGGGGTMILGLLGTMTVAQLLESYVLQPWIVGAQVSLNPFFTLVAVVGFSFLWGISGTILGIPIVAMLKEVFDRVEPLQPFGYILGNSERNAGD